MSYTKLSLSLTLLLVLCVPVGAQTHKGPVNIFDADLGGTCFSPDSIYKISEDGVDKGKEYCCLSGAWSLCPTADTSLELATELGDETGTEEAVFATEPTMENVTIGLYTSSATDPVLQCNDVDASQAFEVDYGGETNLGSPASATGRLNIQNFGVITGVAPEVIGDPLIWWTADETTGGTDGIPCEAGCFMPQKGSVTATNFTINNGFLFIDGASAAMNGHHVMQQRGGASQGQVTLSKPFNADQVLSGAFTIVAAYDPNGQLYGNTEIIGVGRSQTGASGVLLPLPFATTGSCIFVNQDEDITTWGAQVMDDAPIITIMRRTGTTLDCVATITGGLPVSFGTASGAGDLVPNALFERNDQFNTDDGDTQLAEIIIYDSYLTDTESCQLYAYLANKYGLTVPTFSQCPGVITEGTAGDGSTLATMLDSSDNVCVNFDGDGQLALSEDGDVGTIDARLHIEDTLTPFQLSHSAGNDCTWVVDSNGDMVRDCTGNDVTYTDTINFAGVTFTGFPAANCTLAGTEFNLQRGISATAAPVCTAPVADGIGTAGDLVFISEDGTDSFKTTPFVTTGTDNLQIHDADDNTNLNLTCTTDTACSIDQTGQDGENLTISNVGGDVIIDPNCTGVGCSGDTLTAVVDRFSVGNNADTDVTIRFELGGGGDKDIIWDESLNRFVFGVAGDENIGAKDLFLTSGGINSLSGVTEDSVIIDNTVAKTTGAALSVRDAGTEIFSVDATTVTAGAIFQGPVSAHGGNLRMHHPIKTGVGGGPYFSPYLSMEFQRVVGKHATAGVSKYSIMTDSTAPYSVHIGLEDSDWIVLDYTTNANVFYKKFNATAGGTFAGKVNMTGSESFFSWTNTDGISATGTVVGDAYQMISQTNVFTTITPASAEAAKLPQCDGSTVFPSLPLIIVNETASTLVLFPPDASGHIGDGSAGASKNVTTKQMCLCACINATTDYHCSCGGYL